jgi:dGTPase
MSNPRREDRPSGDKKRDQRSAFQRDRDRLLYADALRRLVGVTQVVSPGEGEVFHNRLTHTLKVAQVARRLAEMFCEDKKLRSRVEAWGGISPEVGEAAALAHDLGHPPFGHIAEDELNLLVRDKAGADGYEGNAQSFRIITRLAVRRADSHHGLDLTRATLNATLKYPRLAGKDVRKWGAYREDEPSFLFARSMHEKEDSKPCIEAQIMDWADDITYSIHDTEDFYRAGLIPLHLLVTSDTELERFLRGAIKRRKDIGKPFKQSEGELLELFQRVLSYIPTREAYSGTRRQRGHLNAFAATTIAKYIKGTKLCHPGDGGEGLERPVEDLVGVGLLQELTWFYVINNPGLAAHQYGQRKIIRTLFEIFFEAARTKKWVLFPPQFREEAEAILEEQGDVTPARCARLAADTIASMTDQQALRMYQRLTGQSQGSVLDPIVS